MIRSGAGQRNPWRRARFVALVTLIAGCATAGALAAIPKGGAVYTGKGKDYMNNAPKWTSEATGTISFDTSADGAKVTNFKGTFSYYCGAGTSDVTQKTMDVSNSGTFGAHLSQPDKGPDGKVEGEAYATISGKFTGDGAEASVAYMVDFVFTGSKVAHPYSTKNPKALGCASWVKGTVRAR